MVAEAPIQPKKSNALYYAAFAAITVTCLVAGAEFSSAHAETIPTPSDLDVTFDSLERLMNQLHSPYVTADTVLQLDQVVGYRVHDLEVLIAALKDVAPANAKEVLALEQAYRELSVIKDRLDDVSAHIKALDTMASGYRVNMAAAKDAMLVPTFDVDALEKTHAHVVDLYTNVTYGEVLVTDDGGNLVERNVKDLLYINETSDKISPILAHRLMETFSHTTNGSEGWSLNTGASANPAMHKEGTDHIAPEQTLRCVDIAPTHGCDPKNLDVKRLGEFALAARDNANVSYFQIETGPNVTVAQMKAAITKEWVGKINEQDLQFLLSKVVSNGSGVHIHVEFTHESFYTAYVPEKKVALR